MNAREASVSVLLRGLDGKGVGRAEARELARRFGDDYVPVKWRGEFYVVLREDTTPGEHGAATSLDGVASAWSVAQVADYLWKRERGSFPARPVPRYVVGGGAS